MEQVNEALVVTKQAFSAIGLRWEGTFAEAGEGGIRAIHQELQRRRGEIRGIVDLENFYGLSYHAYPGGIGFEHCAVFEVADADEQVPEGMIKVHVPAMKYAKYEHRAEQNIGESYSSIYAWIEQQGFKLLPQEGEELTHFEIYPSEQDPYSTSPQFTIMIPVLEK
ncbi:effector binding domain-containing protein [Paenibacillus woosongensis]|uniref:Effector binding domain-containing protein n=1 Tax=Paenibacillus woosongensis TaxID=307580 RepID=A0AA95IBC6_9BACL|nr:effector binding domain-containing protein [Paenibacillus woosongensis]WHX48933.1 effector binding domain-containing protein [Paenibacillus woosongensis]